MKIFPLMLFLQKKKIIILTPCLSEKKVHIHIFLSVSSLVTKQTHQKQSVVFGLVGRDGASRGGGGGGGVGGGRGRVREGMLVY